MRRVEDRIAQENRSVQKPHRPLSALEITTGLALLGLTLVFLFQFFFVWLVVGVFLPPVLVFAIVTLIVAGIIVARVRWAPGLGTLVALAASTITLAEPVTVSALLHPTVSVGHFGLLVVLFAFALIAIVAGVAATIQNYSSGERRAPRWLSPVLTGIGGIVVGMIVLAAIVGANPASAPTSTTTNGVPAVHMAGSNFLTNVVLVPKGSKLMLVDDDSTEHIIQNGFWDASGTPHPQAEPGAPVVRNLDIKSGSVEIGPFSTAGVFHLYCSIHKGMNLTVVVQ
ncbi:MAG TPA: hypothetical protein VF026_17270 [Ktedonobacteraceae bacterium]